MDSWRERCKLRMKELHMKQLTLADKLGITRSAVCHYLAQRRIPPLEQFVRIAAALECEPAWLQYGVSNNAVTTKVEPVKRAKGAGGKLNRCMIIQARLDPELHDAAEMMARKQRRTLSNFIEILIEEEVKRIN